ncbi:MAG: NADH-quinone oxidoreductase subunit B family protein [Elusimicrobiota bacterium]
MKLKDKIVLWSRLKSPWIIHFNTGACNGCDIEIVDALTPRYDLERFGIVLKGTPRHADVMVVSGPLTRQQAKRFRRIYDQIPNPKFVLAVGTCACSGGVFDGCYNVVGGIDKVIPVSAYIPGCPARPEAIIDAVVKLITELEKSSKK